MEKIERENLCGKASAMGEKLVSRARRWREWTAQIGDIRADGAMVGIEFVKDRETKEPATEYVASLKAECLKNGVILISTGTFSNTIRFLIPLVIDDETLDEGLDIVERCMRRLPA